MSIWSSWPHIGYEWFGGRKRKPEGGVVRTYARGWSNHYPTLDVEPPASIDFAAIPAWCVPGHEESGESDYERCGPWLRMSLDTDAFTLNEGSEPVPGARVSVVMDERAVTALRDTCDEWLARPKARPKRQSPRSGASAHQRM